MKGLHRIRRVRTSTFTTINNAILRDKSISLRAKAVMVIVMGLPDNWNFSVQGLIAIVKEGRDAIYGAINELIFAGYVSRTETRVKGRFAEVEYVFSEQKLSEWQPNTGFPDTGESHSTNPQQFKKEVINDLRQNLPPEVTASELEYPLSELLLVFPNLRLVPDQVRIIAEVVKDTTLDREAWKDTVDQYRANHDPSTGRYDPQKVGTMLDVFKNKRKRLEEIRNEGYRRNKNGSRSTPGRTIANRPYR